MMRTLSILIAALLCACSHYDPDTSPGDGQAVAWEPPERECQADALVIDCGGTLRGSLDVRDSCVTVRNCRFSGSLRVYGPAASANGIDVSWSRSDHYVAELRDSAPWGVTVEDCAFETTGGIPVYLGPGVTFTTLRRLTIGGPSRSVLVYLGAETYGTTIDQCDLDASKAKREAIAIDASSHNVIRDSTITGGGVYLYRNSGEDGVTRHETPRGNVIQDNVFRDANTAVWLSSRDDDWKAYSYLDDHQCGWGSCVSNWSHARDNEVVDNDLGGGRVIEGDSAHDNIIARNTP